MPNLSQAIKAEIVRIAHKEIKTSVKPLRSASFLLKRQIAALKKQVVALESDNKRFLALQNELQEKNAGTQIAEVKDNKVRVTSKSVKALRAKLGLSQDKFAVLLGVSGQAVYVMEHKGGKLRLRTPTMTKLLSLRGIGKREAAKRLAEVDAKSEKHKETSSKKSKGRKK
jgi:DNA-binding transcriptional regulator YiaG